MEPMIRETFEEARRAVTPVLYKSQELLDLVMKHDMLDQDEQVKAVGHSACGGTFHTVGKVKTNWPMYLRVCDKCGDYYHTR